MYKYELDHVRLMGLNSTGSTLQDLSFKKGVACSCGMERHFRFAVVVVLIIRNGFKAGGLGQAVRLPWLGPKPVTDSTSTFITMLTSHVITLQLRRNLKNLSVRQSTFTNDTWP
jgi:hypothetical protein